MPSFSKNSKEKLRTCHVDLQKIFNTVIREFDCTIVCGYRGEEAQNEAFRRKKSTKQYPDSKHNKKPSLAVDVVPYPIDWEDTDRMYFFCGYVLRVSHDLLIPIRLGADWDKDTEVDDQKFIDLPHFELV